MSGTRTTKVVHCKRAPFDIYIGRPSKWGNPFVIGRDGNRDEVIEKYRAYIVGHPTLLTAVKSELKGKVLGCWCAPQSCHGDVLAGYGALLQSLEGASHSQIAFVHSHLISGN
jgi:hypothetical protein